MQAAHGNPSAALEAVAQTHLADCYQCGKCSAGCPAAQQMDLLPHQLLRLAQMGHIEKAARSEAIWLCLSCQTCTTRCPKSVDCAAVIDALRQQALEHGWTAPGQQRTLRFQQAFLENVRRNGRLAELELIGAFKARAFWDDLNVPFLFKDAGLAPRLVRRRKFHLRGEKVKDRDLVRRIFERCGYGKAPSSRTPG